MADSSPRLPWQLVRMIARVDDPAQPVAETWRRLCSAAEELGVSRPSYERVRQLVARERRIRGMPSPDEPLIGALFRAQGPLEAVDQYLDRSAEIGAARANVAAERAWRPSVNRRDRSPGDA